ncbi:Glycosyltransferase [Rhynchospora pubera]|uniref:Glycosyltransferase n=1 Tax=Rhynchospora pubera TaxID=906938 RepID=A0AAV8C3I5_9POAL|nr:Glycosyltransferase [Rhynchospora pubera]
MVEAAKRLLQCNSASSNAFTITILLMQSPIDDAISCITDSYFQSINSLNLPIHFMPLPPVEPPSCFDGPEDFITIYTQLHLPHVRDAVAQSTSKVVALVLDIFATSFIDLGNELEIPSYIFHAPNAAALALMLHLPILDGKIKQEFGEIDGVVNIPGISSIPSHVMPPSLMNKKSAAYICNLNHGRQYAKAKGIIVNTCLALEPKAIETVAKGWCSPMKPAPKIYPIGPIVSVDRTVYKEYECVKWLDLQPPKSVVFLCFGSGGSFELPQVQEMAIGLERSGHRFLWAIRAIYTGISFPTDENLNELLPVGFTERTKDKGLVLPRWIPQTEILAHPAVTAFVTHCGWNSCLESLWFGVPMITWPLYGEQSLNAFVMVKEMGVALELKLGMKHNRFVAADELEQAIRCLIEGSDEGMRVREKAEEVKNEFRKTIEKGGASYTFMQRFWDEIGHSKIQ